VRWRVNWVVLAYQWQKLQLCLLWYMKKYLFSVLLVSIVHRNMVQSCCIVYITPKIVFHKYRHHSFKSNLNENCFTSQQNMLCINKLSRQFNNWRWYLALVFSAFYYIHIFFFSMHFNIIFWTSNELVNILLCYIKLDWSLYRSL